MKRAHRGQRFQDWFTQQWAILWGRRIEPAATAWLMGPFGKPGVISDGFIAKLAAAEGLLIERNDQSRGLLPSIADLHLCPTEQARLSKEVIDFYERTASYRLTFTVTWNPFFKLFGKAVHCLFSQRLHQLYIPTRNLEHVEEITSEIITLTDPETKQVKYTVWYRTIPSTGQVLYSGVYTTCTLPSGQTCIKAVFPLPHGNATVILSPGVGPTGELQLRSAGKKFGDPGFYFLLQDAKGTYWSQYLRSFRDHLTVGCVEKKLWAEQTLTLWGCEVLRMHYKIQPASEEEST